MKALAALGIVLVAGIELLALLARQRHLMVPAAGVATAVLLVGIRQWMGAFGAEPQPGQQGPEMAGDDVLRHWMSGTQTRIHWSESTRMDWDRHWRPILARRFELATGQRQAKDPVAFAAAGRTLFGDRLWPWVDPGNISRAGGHEPGPGRGALEQILHRLEQR